MLQHVSLEVPPAEVERSVEFWELLGFERGPAPEEIAEYVTWLSRDGTQIHLLHSEAATVPQLGHAAVVAEDWEDAIARLREAGFEVTETRKLWGAGRAFAIAPAGHRVELMEFPPGADTGRADS